MKVKIKLGFVDDKGVHNKGEVLDIKAEHFDPVTMLKLEDEEPGETKPEAKPKKKSSK